MENLISFTYPKDRRELVKFYREKEYKSYFAERVALASADLVNTDGNTLDEPLNSVVTSYLRVIHDSLSASGITVWSIKMETVSNLALNLSGGVFHTILNLGVSLDPILGIPFIPSTSIKGAWRHAVWIILRNLSPDNADTLIEDLFDNIPVVVKVFDAYPTYINSDGGYLVIPDILNPHYTSTTRNELDVNPTPIIHLTIPRGIVFETVVGIDVKALMRSFDESTAEDEEERRRIRDRKERWKDLMNKLAERPEGSRDRVNNIEKTILVILKAGLMLAGKLGIGAKTSVGYSRLEVEINE